MCNVSWPRLRTRTCARDYAAPCPYGWLKTERGRTIGCRAPETYEGCNPVQSFGDMTPDEKKEWEHSCQQRFPCGSRSSCDKDWSAPCPAEWFSFNAGRSCVAQPGYTGNCSLVLHGLQDLSPEQK